MPKIVDHDQRRAEIAQAVRRILLRDGLAGASVRAVVAESGMSSGAIRHYFASHDELLRFAAAGISERAGERVERAFADAHRSPRDRTLDMLEQFVPLDDERRMELAVSMALAELGATREQVDEFWIGIRRVCRAGVLLLADAPLDRPVDDPLRPESWERLAERLHLACDGLAMQALYYRDRTDSRRMRESLRRVVDDVADELGAGPGVASQP